MLTTQALEVSVINSAEELQNLKQEWNDLVLRARGGGIFQTWEWISSCWKHFGRGKKMLVVCVSSGSRLVGLAPFEVVRMYGLPLRRLQLIGTGVSDYLDFILDSESEQAVLHSISTWLKENEHRWDLLDLQNFHADSPSVDLWGSHHTGWQGTVVEQELCPFLPLAESWEAMQSRFGKKMRFNLGYYERTIRRDFENVHIGLLPSEEIDEGMDAFFDLHTQRWRKRFLPGMLIGGRRAFHKDIARCCSETGWLRLHGLRLNGDLKAILYCFAFKGKGYYYLGGFSPDLSKYSLGTVLTGAAIKDAIGQGCDEFDFLRGNEPYKSRWTKEARMNSRLIVRKETSPSRLAASICSFEQRVEQRVKHELHKRIGAG